MTLPAWLLMLLILMPLCGGLAGVVLGAWLWHRAVTGRSPVPPAPAFLSRPAPEGEAEADPDNPPPRKVKL